MTNELMTFDMVHVAQFKTQYIIFK